MGLVVSQSSLATHESLRKPDHACLEAELACLEPKLA
ncbi:hypothetical protein SAMN04489733_6238 [Amycolatopsis keratiniphila]|nr:hypothetical protein SAMN04489733_6238 [Amycolatopsis keratiniphila]